MITILLFFFTFFIVTIIGFYYSEKKYKRSINSQSINTPLCVEQIKERCEKVENASEKVRCQLNANNSRYFEPLCDNVKMNKSSMYYKLVFIIIPVLIACIFASIVSIIYTFV